jgi:hypothetical protein
LADAVSGKSAELGQKGNNTDRKEKEKENLRSVFAIFIS